jgi:hypothetical protein
MQKKGERNKRGFTHESAHMITDQWLTPPEIIKSLGEFDLDPSTPIIRPWDTAKHHFNINDDGLIQEWFGRVWMNPPYGRECVKWLKKLAEHNNGTTLIFARTETKMFFEYCWDRASSIFFFEGRIQFYDVHGNKGKGSAGAPSCLVAYGFNNSDAIEESGLKGKHVPLKYTPMIIIGVSPSWKDLVKIAFTRANGDLELQEIYNMVEEIAPDKVQQNKNYKEKIRQKLQQHFTRKGRGVYTI